MDIKMSQFFDIIIRCTWEEGIVDMHPALCHLHLVFPCCQCRCLGLCIGHLKDGCYTTSECRQTF